MKKQILFLSIISLLLIGMITILFKNNTYELTFVVDSEIYNILKIRKNTILTSLEPPKKEGYSFIGWYDEEKELLKSNQKITEDKVYYARFAKIVTEEE